MQCSRKIQKMQYNRRSYFYLLSSIIKVRQYNILPIIQANQCAILSYVFFFTIIIHYVIWGVGMGIGNKKCSTQIQRQIISRPPPSPKKSSQQVNSAHLRKFFIQFGCYTILPYFKISQFFILPSKYHEIKNSHLCSNKFFYLSNSNSNV